MKHFIRTRPTWKTFNLCRNTTKVSAFTEQWCPPRFITCLYAHDCFIIREHQRWNQVALAYRSNYLLLRKPFDASKRNHHNWLVCNYMPLFCGLCIKKKTLPLYYYEIKNANLVHTKQYDLHSIYYCINKKKLIIIKRIKY